ncbi:MAG: DNA recombination protein RmuC [Peptostreptococcaceae bacterium]|nr:DNA recombination protein RmuC [Peptostreptococcaceae bacterium]
MEYLVLAGIVAVLMMVVIILVKLNSLESKITESNRDNSTKLDSYFRNYGDLVSDNQKNMAEAQDKRLTELKESLNTLKMENEQKLEAIRNVTENKLTDLTRENNRQLEDIRKNVDEKLQKTLDEKLTQSFQLVNDRLEQVYKGLGEMQTIAANVGDLKKVLSNVKTRGILGEVQLEAILEQILSPEQYEKNVATKKGSNDRVEFAIKFPGNDNGVVYLPIDAKFPGDSYSKLVDAYEVGDQEIINEAAKALAIVIKKEAKDISEKYIDPPYTTDFGIMFLPFEGLYAEVVRRGMLEELQRKYKITIAGPTTMAALLNSFQMGFNTLAIQKRSSEVWEILGAVKTEFGTFESALQKAQEKISQANNELDKLVGTRTRQIQRKLKDVTSLNENDTSKLLDD